MPTATCANSRRRYLTIAWRSIAKPIARRTRRVPQDRVLLIQAHVGVVGALRGGDSQPALGAELPDDVGREIVDHEIDCALAQLEAAHRVVRHDLQHDAGVARAFAVVAVEGLEHEAVILHERLQSIRPRADWRAGVRVPGSGLDDSHDQVDGERSERFFELELDGVAILRRDRRQLLTIGAGPAAERRIEQAAECVDDVVRGQLAPVVKQDAVAQRRDVGQSDRRARMSPPDRGRRSDPCRS